MQVFLNELPDSMGTGCLFLQLQNNTFKTCDTFKCLLTPRKEKLIVDAIVFNKTRTAKKIKGRAVCFICGTQVAVLKDYN